MVQTNKKRYRQNWQIYTVVRLFVKERVNILTTKNAIKMIILILTTALMQIEVIRVKGHWIFGGNVVFPFLAAILLWYLPSRFKDFKGEIWNTKK